MLYYIIAVRDRAADVFATPVCVANLGGAIRSFSDEVNRNDPANQYFNHPDDFDLFELGKYDDSEAVFQLLAKPRQIAIGKDLKRSES